MQIQVSASECPHDGSGPWWRVCVREDRIIIVYGIESRITYPKHTLGRMLPFLTVGVVRVERPSEAVELSFVIEKEDWEGVIAAHISGNIEPVMHPYKS